MNKSNSKYLWFTNKDKFQYDSINGIELKLDNLKVILLDSNKQYNLNINNKIYKITHEAHVKDKNNKLRYFGISDNKNKIFIIRMNEKREYDKNLIYRKSDFLALCTIVNRKLK